MKALTIEAPVTSLTGWSSRRPQAALAGTLHIPL
jgi:hypothetical protein